MAWNDLFSRDNQPEITDVAEYIGTKEWDKLYHELTEVIGAKPKLEHSRCSIPGWNMKFKKKGKNLCTAYPQAGQVQVLIIANQQYQAEIEALIATSDKRVQKAYEKYDFFNGGKWMIFDIDDEEILADALKLIQFRLL